MPRTRFSAAFAAVLLLSMQPLAADPAIVTAPSAAVPDQCGGKDMLAEIATKEPDAHRKIMDEAAQLENTEAILWKVEKAGVPPSYLFGTIHLPDQRVKAISAVAKAAFAKSKTVALEIANTSEAGMMEAMTKVPELLAYTDGTTLNSQLTADEYAKVQKLITKTGMPGEAASVIRPWLISMLLAISDCNKLQMEAGKKALDDQLETDAKANGASVIGLETAEGQLAKMASVPNDAQILMLKSGLAYAHRTDDMIETLIQMYLTRKIGATMPFQKMLAEKSGVPASAFDSFMKILIDDRNVKMRDNAKPLFDKGEAFVAVGALHLPGKNGLVTLLRGAGYTVTAVE
ncbi:MAG: TraB/GumN family protein [Hyphomicrobium sp.]